MPLVDVVNFNADASCLSSRKWLLCLEGGENSLVYKWLKGYVDNKRKDAFLCVDKLLKLNPNNQEAKNILNKLKVLTF